MLLSTSVYAQKVNLNLGKANSKNYYEEIKFELVNDKIIVPVEIEGKTYRFILDTGAPNIISKKLDSILNPKSIGIESPSDVNEKKQSLKVVQIKKLTFGKVMFVNTPTLVYDLNSNPLFKCFKIDGFIGSNMLRNSIIQIDSRKKTIILTNSKHRLSLKRKESRKMELTGNQSSPYLWIKLQGKDTGKEQVLIDTGDNGLYDLSGNHYKIFARKEIFGRLGKSTGANSLGLFGDAPVNTHYRLLLPQLKINNCVLKGIVTITSNDDNSKIGSELLHYGIMTIDFKNKRFYFHPNSKVCSIKNAQFPISMTYKNSKLVVGFVWDNELKEKIQYGDEIIAINNVPINNSTICAIVTGKSPYKKHNSMALKIKSKSNKILNLTVNKRIPATLAYK